MKILEMTEYTGSGLVASTDDALKDALADVGVRGALEKGRKVLVLSLDDRDTRCDFNSYQAGMKTMELVALCELAKKIFLDQMEN